MVSRKPLCILTLGVFLATASGAVLCAHESLHGPNHDQQGCPVCQDLLAGSKAVESLTTRLPAPADAVAVATLPAAQRPVVPALTPAIAPRGPPAA
jgi:hypothetical protein